MDNRSLPRNIQAEKALISGMVQSESFFWTAQEAIKEDMFSLDYLKKCFVHLTTTKNRDAIIVDDLLMKHSEGNFGIGDLYEISYSTTGKSEISLVLEYFNRRETITACNIAINACYDTQDGNAYESMSKVVTRVSGLSSGVTGKICKYSDLIPQELERIELVLSKKKQAADLKTGLIDVDELCTIQNYHYIILAARPSNGKSTLTSHILRCVSRETNRPVLSFFLDSDKRAEARRAIFAESGLSISDFNNGSMSITQIKRLKNGCDSLDKLPYYIIDEPTLTPEQMVAIAQRVKSESGDLAAVTVDFLQNVNSGIRGTPREQINHISRVFHNAPKITNCPWIALSQLSRYEKEDQNPPYLGLLKESGNLEADADIVWMLWYQAKYCRTDENANKLNFYVAKNKDGDCGSLQLGYHANIGKIFNLTKEQEDQYAVFRG